MAPSSASALRAEKRVVMALHRDEVWHCGTVVEFVFFFNQWIFNFCFCSMDCFSAFWGGVEIDRVSFLFLVIFF